MTLFWITKNVVLFPMQTKIVFKGAVNFSKTNNISISKMVVFSPSFIV